MAEGMQADEMHELTSVDPRLAGICKDCFHGEHGDDICNDTDASFFFGETLSPEDLPWFQCKCGEHQRGTICTFSKERFNEV